MTRIVNTADNMSGHSPETSAQTVLGWREWVSLPDLGIPAIKAKIDTGAKTSSLHAFRIEPFTRDDKEQIRFWLHPLRKKQDIELICEAEIRDKRNVKDSGGHTEERYVIETCVHVGPHKWNIELTLTSREDMMFRMLLGRSAIIDANMVIDPTASYVTGRSLSRIYKPKSRKRKVKT